MSKSIISNKEECLICKTPLYLHRHHIFFGSANRKLSEKYGCWCYLCARHHNMSDEGVHFDKPLDIKLKRYCQQRWEAKYGDREQFIQVFGKSYM